MATRHRSLKDPGPAHDPDRSSPPFRKLAHQAKVDLPPLDPGGLNFPGRAAIHHRFPPTGHPTPLARG